MVFEAIVVPRGAEARAVERGWPAPRPILVVVPAGAAAGKALVAAPRVQTALVLGVCGALDPALRVGDTVVYARVADGHDVIELDRELAAACAAVFGRPPLSAAVVARVVGTVTEKSALRANTGAAVIDMEAASVARALQARGVRVAMVRVVSDDARSELPDLSRVYDAAGAIRPLSLTAALVGSPGRSLVFIVRVFQALRALRRTAARLSRSATR